MSKMPKKSTGEILVFLNLGDLGEDIEATLEYTYIPGTKDVMWLPNGDPGYPGDPSEIEIESFMMLGKDFDFFQLTEAAQDMIYQKIEDKFHD